MSTTTEFGEGARFGATQRGLSTAAASWVARHEAMPGFLMLADACIAFGTGLVCIALRFQPWQPWSNLDAGGLVAHLTALFLHSLLIVLFCRNRGLYGQAWIRRRELYLRDAAKAIGSASLVLILFIYVVGARNISRELVTVSALFSGALLLAWRYWLCTQGIEGINEQRNVLIVGANKTGQSLRDYFDRNRELGFAFRGFLAPDNFMRRGLTQGSLVGEIKDFEAAVHSRFIDEVFIALPMDRELVKEVALRARMAGIDAYVVPDLYDGLASGVPVESVGPFPALSLHRRPIPALQLILKRMIDIVGSMLALVVFSPIMALIAILIKIDSRGPIIYSSERVGKKGKIFKCHKFRTMVANADALKAKLLHLNERDGILFKISNDPRVTRAGRLLRQSSLDELPQFWNVLKGEMSLVGPRPPLASEVAQYELEHLRRLEVVPGITGLWQVKARQSSSFGDYINLDLYYVDNWSTWLDIKLLFKTVAVVLSGTGR